MLQDDEIAMKKLTVLFWNAGFIRKTAKYHYLPGSEINTGKRHLQSGSTKEEATKDICGARRVFPR